MALEPASGLPSGSPDSSGSASPIPRQWRNQLGGDEPPIKDKNFRRYASAVDKALSLFETALEEWADYISFLNRLLKALQARPSSVTTIPSKVLVAKRLSQCLNPSLPSGVHQKTLEVYDYVLTTIGKDGLSRDLPLYLPGLAPTLSFASLSVRSPFLDLIESHVLTIDPRSLRPAIKSLILALLPGLEDESSEDFERTLSLVARLKAAIRPPNSERLDDKHSTGDHFFWQCFFLASITSQGRRSGALAYLARYLPALGPPSSTASPAAASVSNGIADNSKSATMVTSPEPGLLIRCFVSGLADDQLLIQRGFLDLLVTHLPLNSSVLQSRVKQADLDLLLKAAVGVVARREMSLNRRLWTWLLGPDPGASDFDSTGDSISSISELQQAPQLSRTSYFEKFGLQPLTRALLGMIEDAVHGNLTERARPYRICLSLMDRWEIGGLVVPEVFLPVVESVRQFQSQASTKHEFLDVLRSASVFFDGIEAGLIYSELVGLLARAIGPGDLSMEDRLDKISLVGFIIANFNVREEEMTTVHAPLSCLAAMTMLNECSHGKVTNNLTEAQGVQLSEGVLGVVASMLELIPDRAFPEAESMPRNGKPDSRILSDASNAHLLKRIRTFYTDEQGNLEASRPPLDAAETGEWLLRKAVEQFSGDVDRLRPSADFDVRVRILTLVLLKTPASYKFDIPRLLSLLAEKLARDSQLPFPYFSSILQLVTQLYFTTRINLSQLSELVMPLVRHAWSFLSACEPKYHVETVRCLWQLQTALTPTGREIEAALSTIIVERLSAGRSSVEAVDAGHTFGVLWTHTLQDTSSDRRGSKTLLQESRPAWRLAGMDHYQVMLTRPFFLIMDALLDERTQLYIAVKSWLNNMFGIDRLYLLLASQISEISFLESSRTGGTQQTIENQQPLTFDEDDDLNLCLYFLRTLHNILGCTGEASHAVLSSRYISFSSGQAQVRVGAEDDEVTLQEYFVRVCLKCITGEPAPAASVELIDRVAQLHRYSLIVLHQFLTGKFSLSLAPLHLDDALIDRLSKSINSHDPYVQVLLLEVVNEALKIQGMVAPLAERSTSSGPEKISLSMDNPRTSRGSVSAPDSRPMTRAGPVMPPQLLKCLQSGLSASRSRTVLDSWVAFLGACLPYYSHCIFQILIPLVETFCRQIAIAFSRLRETFYSNQESNSVGNDMPESTLIHLLNGLEQLLGTAHEQLLADEARVKMAKSPEQPQSLFGSMVSGVFQSDGSQPRSSTANNRLTVHLAIQDAMRICYRIWSWGQGDEAKRQVAASSASLIYTSLRMRNRARRLLEHLFAAETLECLETVVDIWKSADSEAERSQVFSLLSALDACRPKHFMPALFNSIYSRTNPSALEPSRKSTMTISLQDLDLAIFLVDYVRSLDDDAMDEIWQDCMTFLRDLLANPFPHRQTLPSLLEFSGILGQKVDNTNFGEQRKMRRELGDLFLRLLAALFTTRPITYTETPSSEIWTEESAKDDSGRRSMVSAATDGPDHVVSVLATVVPNLGKILLDGDRVLSAAGTISTNAIVPTLRSKGFPDNITPSFMRLLRELARLPNNQKTWRRDVGEAFNDGRFFGMPLGLLKADWLPLLSQWILADREKMAEMIGRISAPATAGIVFGVGATSARLEADRKTQLNLRRMATLVLASAEDTFVSDLEAIFDKLVELLAATSTSSPSSTTRADLYMVIQALVLRTSPVQLAMLWPVVSAELHAALSSVATADSETYGNAALFQACKLLDLVVCVAPDDFQLHEWLFVTDTVDAVYRSSDYQPVALVDELADELSGSGGGGGSGAGSLIPPAHAPVAAASSSPSSLPRRRPLLGPGGLAGDGLGSIDGREELVAKVLRPFFGQLTIYAFESVYALGPLDREACVESLLRDLFDEHTMVRAL